MGHAQLSESVPFGSKGTPAMPSNISFARWEYASGGSGKGAWVSAWQAISLQKLVARIVCAVWRVWWGREC
jgi:hypothetical protein